MLHNARYFLPGRFKLHFPIPKNACVFLEKGNNVTQGIALKNKFGLMERNKIGGPAEARQKCDGDLVCLN